MVLEANEESIEQRIARLTRERDALALQQQQLRAAELRRLADEFAQQLAAAGLSVTDAISALQPHAVVRHSGAGEPQRAPRLSVIRPAPYVTAPKSTPRPPMDDVHIKAQDLLGRGAAEWLQSPHALLGGISPLQMASTPRGKQRVLALLEAYQAV